MRMGLVCRKGKRMGSVGCGRCGRRSNGPEGSWKCIRLQGPLEYFTKKAISSSKKNSFFICIRQHLFFEICDGALFTFR